jgi:hypothetical protein
MMGPTGYPETSVQDYHSTLRYVPEERRYCGNECSDSLYITVIWVAEELSASQ